MLGRAACHLPPPHSLPCNHCSLPVLAQFVANSFILMCEWLSVPSTGTAEKGESGGKRVFQEAASAPLHAPRPHSHLVCGSSRSPWTLLVWLPPQASPSDGHLPPGTSYIPSRAACSLLQPQYVPCILPTAQASPLLEGPAGHHRSKLQEGLTRWASAALCLLLPASGLMRSPLPAGRLSSV